MKRFSLILFCLFTSGLVHGQEICFTVHYHSEYSPWDSVLVENLSQGGDTTLYWPDTVLNLDHSAVPDLAAAENGFELKQNFPNPFSGTSKTEMVLPREGEVSMQLYDLHGQKLAAYSAELESGRHEFAFCTGGAGACLLSARFGKLNKQIKIMDAGNPRSKNAQIIYQGMKEILPVEKRTSARAPWQYNTGDNLRFTCFVNGHYVVTTGNPEESTSFQFDVMPTFNFVIETTAENTDYSFTVGGADDFEVIWEPGVSEVYNTSNISHNFGEAGLWQIKVRGHANYIMFNENADMFRDILSPVSPSVSGLMMSANMFRSITVSSFTCEDFFDEASEGISDMTFMFAGSSFNQDISNWDLSQATDLRGIFSGSDFNQPLDAWDVHNVEVFAMMFSHSIYNQDISGWDVSGATDMSDMFSYSEFNQDIGNWDVSNVTNMACMFSYSVFNQDIGNWDVSSVTNMGYMDYNTNGMFQNSAFDQDISSWDVSNVTSFHNFLKNSALSTEHYNNLLIQWSELDLQPSLNFYGGSSMYDLGLPAERRQYIIDEFGWNIIDSGDTGEQY